MVVWLKAFKCAITSLESGAAIVGGTLRRADFDLADIAETVLATPALLRR